MEAIEFVQKYNTYLTEIQQVIKPELLPIIEELNETDPHDLVRPEGYFNSESHALGLVWTLFLRKVKK